MIKKAYFAGGCFWCTESVFQRVKGVIEVTPGYMGGHVKNPAYREVCNGITGHTETIKITYDQDIVPYSSLLEIFFLFHDPTTLNRQGNDIGTQYRSAIFYNNLEEKNQIHACIDQFEKDKIYSDPIVTEINIECPFYPAEVEHHNYYNRNSEQPYCHYVITPKIKKLESLFKQYTILE
ncbi:MAG: peptide-methionine (S)-S-oxide reductase MsrA [Flavobacteriaceae bacterium]|nr:peptide-methionine (S)-S-oxide reductase MsrA [Flavobacteriaceae bacterium]